MLNIPTIETERLRLRGHQLSDFADCCRLWGDAVVTRYIRKKPFSADEVWARIMRYAGHWALLNYGFWAITEKDSGKLVGEVGLMDFKRALTPEFDTAPECGWVLSPEVFGRGYATEAVKAVGAWGDEHLRAARTTCIIQPENKASIGVAEKCGFRQSHPASVHEDPVLVFVRGRV